MAKLTQLKPLIPKLGGTVSMLPRLEAEKPSDQSWRSWYGLQRWKDLRWSVLVRDLYTCQLCGRFEHDTSQLVADHKVAHKGQSILFWDEANLWCLCKPCHDSVKQSEEKNKPLY